MSGWGKQRELIGLPGFWFGQQGKRWSFSHPGAQEGDTVLGNKADECSSEDRPGLKIERPGIQPEAGLGSGSAAWSTGARSGLRKLLRTLTRSRPAGSRD